jgi:hypothetical protein
MQHISTQQRAGAHAFHFDLRERTRHLLRRHAIGFLHAACQQLGIADERFARWQQYCHISKLLKMQQSVVYLQRLFSATQQLQSCPSMIVA